MIVEMTSGVYFFTFENGHSVRVRFVKGKALVGPRDDGSYLKLSADQFAHYLHMAQEQNLSEQVDSIGERA